MSPISMDAAGERDPFLFRSRKPEKEPSETGSNSNRAKVTSVSIFQKPSMFTSKSSINLREPHIVQPQSSQIAEHYPGAGAGKRDWASNDEEKPLRPGAFYLLMGMKPQLELFAISDPLDQPAGLYHDIKAGQRRAAIWFRRLDQLIIVALLTQVLLASTILFLIGLEVHFQKIFLVFSYLNMILAVVVAYAKCSEILSRIQKERDALCDLQLYVEDLYWKVGTARAVFSKDIDNVRKRFEDIRKGGPDLHAARKRSSQSSTSTINNAPDAATVTIRRSKSPSDETNFSTSPTRQATRRSS